MFALVFFFVIHLYPPLRSLFFFFNDTATTEIYTLSLHDALPISPSFTTISAQNRARCARRFAGSSAGAHTNTQTDPASCFSWQEKRGTAAALCPNINGILCSRAFYLP